MEVKQIIQLMAAMGKAGIKKLVIKREGCEVELEREERAPVGKFLEVQDAVEEHLLRPDFEKGRAMHVMTQEGYRPPLLPQREGASQEAAKEEGAQFFITSPMVGTLYHSPSPTDAAFVKVGDRVEKNTIVCIIEAMKVMNEVKAGASGVISEILIDNGHPVEFGTKLFRLTPVP